MSQRTGGIQTRERNRDKFPIVFINDSGETVPAFAIMQINSTEGVPLNQAQLVHVVKPTTDGKMYMFNGPLDVRDGKKGRGRLTSPAVSKCSGTLAVGDSVGPSDGSWEVSSSGSGYKCVGADDDGVVLVAIVGGSGSSKRTAVLKATDAIAGATGDRTPATSGDYTVVKGDTPAGDIENWSTVGISVDSYMVTLEIDGTDVIIDVFC